MRTRRTQWFLSAAAIATAGMLYQTACMSFAGNEVLRAVDFCFLFDCQNGALGGLIDPCSNPVVADDSGDGTVRSGNLFVDCPVTATQ